MGGLVEIIATLTPTAAVGGGGFAWIWSQLQKWKAGIDADLARCEERAQQSDARRNKLIVVIELLWRAVERNEPGSPELSRSKELMDEYKSIGRNDAKDGGL